MAPSPAQVGKVWAFAGITGAWLGQADLDSSLH